MKQDTVGDLFISAIAIAAAVFMILLFYHGDKSVLGIFVIACAAIYWGLGVAANLLAWWLNRRHPQEKDTAARLPRSS